MIKSAAAPRPPGNHAPGIVDLAAALAGEAAANLPEAGWHAIHEGRENGLTVLLVLDGVGCAQLALHAKGGALAGQQRDRLCSVFPSSTAPAITSLLSAKSVGQHGNPGWFMLEPQSQRVIRTLPMDFRGETPGDGSVPESVDPSVWTWQPWSRSEGVESYCLQPIQIAESVFSRHGFSSSQRLAWDSLSDLSAQFRELIALTRGQRRYVYVYVPDFDSTCHQFGWQSDQANACLVALDELFSQLAEVTVAENGRLLMVADHGFTDIRQENQHDIADYPDLARHLNAPLTGEPRAAFCHVNDHLAAQFTEVAARQLADICEVYDSRSLIEAGWFGRDVDAMFAQRVGSHTLVTKPGHSISDLLPGERRHQMIGMHGGTTDGELWVPLCIA